MGVKLRYFRADNVYVMDHIKSLSFGATLMKLGIFVMI